jgi:predicted lipoprotein with Yx(FWY)xxD motif
VTVRLFRSADVLPKDSVGAILPFKSYRIGGNPRYGTAAHGRIKDGLLTTDPVDMHMPFYGNRVETEFFIRDLRLRIKLGDNDATGTLGGYHDLGNWWDYVRKMGYLIETAQFSCPALYQAALALADGHPDPKTGACTSLSVAYDIKAVRAFVLETPPPIPMPQAAERTPIDPATLPFGLTQQTTGVGTVLADTAGMTLYVPTAKDCTGKCRTHFAALPAPWIATSGPQWSTSLTQDLGRQWLFAGRPVYTCDQDNRPGDTHCLRDGWGALIVKPRVSVPNFVTVQRSELGPIIADRQGRTLYTLIGNLAPFKKEICDDACFAAQWHLAIVDAPVAGQGPLSTVEVEGHTVAAYRGKPLYTFAGDTTPSAIAGHRFGGASVSAKNWFSAIRLDEATTDAKSAEE